MLTVALVTSNAIAAEAIAQMLDETRLFRLVYRNRSHPDASEVVRAIRATDVEVLLIDIGEWAAVSGILTELQRYAVRVLPVGFRPDWTMGQLAAFSAAGIQDLLTDPFSPQDLVWTVYEGLHRDHPVTNQNILAFMPAKAGSGCSTVALHTAAAMANEFGRSTLLLEGDRRSGVFSILLDLQAKHGMAGALQAAGEMTELGWRQYCESAFGLDMVLADPAHRGHLPTWAEYYQLLRFVQDRYDFVVADLPEVVNEATAEIVRNARGVMIVCTPELPSLKMALYRCMELEDCEVPQSRIHVILNRYERGGLTEKDAEKVLERPVFAALPNDYARIRSAVMGSRLVVDEAPFARGCKALAERLGGLPEGAQKQGRFSLLQKLGRMME